MLLIKKYLATFSLIFLTFFSLASFAMGGVNWNPKVFKQLNYGIYWFKYNPKTNKDKVMQASARTANSQCHAKGLHQQCFYDPTKPTMIFFHGYEPLSVQYLIRQDFTFANPGTKKVTNTLKAWKEGGWNVGVFYWNQFADDIPFRTLRKIYSAKNPKTGKYAMYWKKYISQGKSVEVKDTKIKQNMTQLALANYAMAMKGYKGDNIRVVGHSLGGQLVIQFALAVNKAVNANKLAANLMPARMALLDPVYSPLPTDYLPDNESSAKYNYQSLQQLLSKQNLHRLKTVAEYRSSWWSFPTSPYTWKIDKMVALIIYTPNYLKRSYFKNWLYYWLTVHNAARFLYFDSFAHKAPPLLAADGKLISLPAASAATSAKRIQALMQFGDDGLQIMQIAGNTKSVDTSKAVYKIAAFKGPN